MLASYSFDDSTIDIEGTNIILGPLWRGVGVGSPVGALLSMIPPTHCDHYVMWEICAGNAPFLSVMDGQWLRVAVFCLPFWICSCQNLSRELFYLASCLATKRRYFSLAACVNAMDCGDNSLCRNFHCECQPGFFTPTATATDCRSSSGTHNV